MKCLIICCLLAFIVLPKDSEIVEAKISVADGRIVLHMGNLQYAMTPNLADAIGQDLQTEARLLNR